MESTTNILITGGSGAGKTTVGRVLKSQGYFVIDVDEDGFCFWHTRKDNKKVLTKENLDKAFVDAHQWLCNEQKLEKSLDREGINFVVGSPTNLSEILQYFDKFFLLECSTTTFLERINKRTDNDFGKDKTTQELVKQYYEEIRTRMLKEGAVVVDAEQSPAEVVKSIVSLL